MKIKSVKGKIATGVVAASLLGTAAFSFANTNAGSQFTAWGDKQIEAALNAVTGKAGTERTTAQGNINTKANNDKDAAEGRIDAEGTAEKTQTAGNINTKLGEHVNSLTAAFNEFSRTLGGKFDDKVLAENGKNTEDLNFQYASLSTSITNALEAAEASNVEMVTEESLLVKGQATSDLIKKINEVKSGLTGLINTEKTNADSEVALHLSGEVSRINGQLDTLIKGLESSAKTAIENAGDAVEASAIANFERVINRTQFETPIMVDPQKLKWTVGNALDGKVSFKVENSNEFDVVFRYKFEGTVKGQESGVSETPFAENTAKPGKTEFTFNSPLLGGTMEVEWLDHNGVWKKAGKFGPF